ncbi:MAG: ABC-F family ATP-binding cassette domain-containing protein [Beijerinckiaceae bacterium]|nr:ABC-F family ATP-binding cassette domain-containing protein [Beijerinckiaceae bacterium]
MAGPALLSLQNTTLTFGGTPLLEGADLSLSAGDRVCLVGRNGSGKSTLLKIAAGLVEADGGTRFLQPGTTLRYLPQEPDLTGFATTLAYVEAGLGPGDDPYRARYLLESLGLTGEENPASLSGGEQRRAALARVLAPSPDLLLLDEPTNHLDLPAIEWLENELSGLACALALISHDRRFLEKLTNTTVWIDRGRTLRLGQGFSAFEQWRDGLLEEEEKDLQKLDRKIVAEEHWVRYGVTARRKRNVRRMAELDALRKKKREHRRVQGQAKMEATEAEGSGSQVILAQTINKSFGDRPIVRDLSLRLMRGDRLGIVGPNGAGKTTLINMLTGNLAPDDGEVTLGTNLALVALDQRRAALDANRSVEETITEGRGDTVEVNGARRHVVGYLKDFLFTPLQVRQPVSALSGGERARLLLARALATPSNLMVLDEPTNDLDLETLDLLEELLADYKGTLIVVSHDRDFLDRICSSILMAEGDGKWIEYAGGYSDMVAQRGEGVKARAAEIKAKVRDEKPSAIEANRSISNKLSFKEKHLLDTLPEKVDAMGRDIEKLRTALAEPDLYTRDRARFDKISALLTKMEEERAKAEEEWLALEMKREELEG